MVFQVRKFDGEKYLPGVENTLSSLVFIPNGYITENDFG